MIDIHCANCHRAYPPQGAPFRCPTCGGLYDYVSLLEYDPAKVDLAAPGLWRYRHTLGLPDEAPVVSLGEGNTPLEWREVFGRQVSFKLEYLNPTGSFKDRGSAPLVSFLRSRGVAAAVEDSSGNAGASFAAYAAHAGLQARVFAPAYASGPKRDQIQAYGAELISIPGPRSNASQAVLEQVEAGAIYASHAYMPFGLLGYATAAYELYEQIGAAPGAVIVPAGQGNFLLSIGRGFQALRARRASRAYSQAGRRPGLGLRALVGCVQLWRRRVGLGQRGRDPGRGGAHSLPDARRCYFAIDPWR